METVFTYDALGTTWKVTLFDECLSFDKDVLRKDVEDILTSFDDMYSRFKKDSLVTRLSKITGVVEVPKDLVSMLELYKSFFELTEKAFTPCVGHLLEDIGYDSDYTLVEREEKRKVPDFEEAITLVDETHIELREHVLLDLGALGKGYCVDLIAAHLKEKGVRRFLVDGSGDVYYKGNGIPLEMGLEDPHDFSKVIGVCVMQEGAMCSSAHSRRRWGTKSHYISPLVGESPTYIQATWVTADTCVLADALSSVLFFTPGEIITDTNCNYCVMNKERKIKTSPGFQATFF